MTQKINNFLEQAFLWLAKHNWQVIGAGALFLILFEVIEITLKGEPFNDLFHALELVIYIVVFILVGLLINSLRRANTTQDHALAILNYKHDIIREMTNLEDWEELTTALVKIPGTIANVAASRLFLRNPISGEFEAVAPWIENDTENSNFDQDCRKCLEGRSGIKLLFSECASDPVDKNLPVQSQEYCLPLNYANTAFAQIQFKLKPGEILSEKQFEKLDSIRDDMALVLKTGQEQERLYELRQIQSALKERHSISTYLHDHLSQNLAYLCLKLNQLSSGKEPFSEDGLYELQRMNKAANQSYEIVRSFLETSYPETTPRLVNLISAHVKKVSQRAQIDIQIKRKGKEVPILPDTQQAIFYVVREALNNVEKHSGAKKAKVQITWGEECLTVSISDNGIGFNTQNVDGAKHFGIEIMQDRIETINGRIDIQSSENSGTEVTFNVPVLALQKEEIR